MNKDERQKRILQIFINESYCTISTLACLLNVSKRTIHYDIKELEKKGYIFDKKRGVGIKLRINEKVNELKLNKKNSHLSNIKYIFKRLVANSETVSISEFSDMLYVSPSSINNEINKLKELCKDYEDLKFVFDKKGTRVVGSESARQQFMVYFNSNILEQEKTVDCTDFSKLNEIYGEKIINTVKLISEDINDLNLKFVYPYYQFNITNVLIVMLYRICKGYRVEANAGEFEGKSIYLIENYAIANDILHNIQKRLPFDLDEKDVIVLSKYLHGNRLEINTEIINEKKYKKISRYLINKMSQAISEDLNKDIILKQNLTIHIYHMIYRMKNNILLKNPLLNDIIKDFRLMYDLVWLILDSSKEKLKIEVTEDEIGFLVLHFQAALDRKRSSKMIYLALNKNYVSQDFVIQRVRKIVHPLDVIKTIDINAFENYNLKNIKDIDMLITVKPIVINNLEVVVVSPLITEKDLEKISDKYQKLIYKKEENEKEILSKYINYDFIFVGKKYDSKEKILKEILCNLIKKGYVKQEYFDSVLLRETKGNTSIGYNSAVPHGSFKYVNKTIVPVWLNGKNINWNDDKVTNIFLYAISNNDLKESKKIIMAILNFIRHNHGILKSISNKDQFIDLLENFI